MRILVFLYMRKYEINSHKFKAISLGNISCVAFILLRFSGHISTPASKRIVSNIHTEGYCESVTRVL